MRGHGTTGEMSDVLSGRGRGVRNRSGLGDGLALIASDILITDAPQKKRQTRMLCSEVFSTSAHSPPGEGQGHAHILLYDDNRVQIFCWHEAWLGTTVLYWAPDQRNASR